MKKTRIRIIVLLLMSIICIENKTNAQIQIVGDDYSSNLTASKSYYERDVDFDHYFPISTPQKVYGYMEKDFNCFSCSGSGFGLNLTGDTLYLYKNTKFESASFGVASNGSILHNIHKGYYIIDGYVFCIENVNEIRRRYGLESLSNLSKNDCSGTYAISKRLKDKILKNEIKDNKDIIPFLRYMVVRPVDTTQTIGNATYYLLTSAVDGWEPTCDDTEDVRDFIPVRFYNEARKFIGKEVVWIEGMVDYSCYSGNNYGKPVINTKTPNCYDLRTNIYKDGITKDLVKLQDTKYICKDVVLNGEGKFYVVLFGENTGSFAAELERIIYAQDSRDVGTDGDFYRNHENNKLRDIPCLMIYSQAIDRESGGYIIESKNIPALAKREKMVQAQRDKEEQQREAARKKEEEQRKAAFIQQMTVKYGPKYGELVGKKQLAIGMTKEMCIDAWGKPMNTYRTTTSFEQSEVWCYNYKTRVYFHDSQVVQIDD